MRGLPGLLLEADEEVDGVDGEGDDTQSSPSTSPLGEEAAALAEEDKLLKGNLLEATPPVEKGEERLHGETITF